MVGFIDKTFYFLTETTFVEWGVIAEKSATGIKFVLIQLYLCWWMADFSKSKEKGKKITRKYLVTLKEITIYLINDKCNHLFVMIYKTIT